MIMKSGVKNDADVHNNTLDERRVIGTAVCARDACLTETDSNASIEVIPIGSDPKEGRKRATETNNVPGDVIKKLNKKSMF